MIIPLMLPACFLEMRVGTTRIWDDIFNSHTLGRLRLAFSNSSSLLGPGPGWRNFNPAAVMKRRDLDILDSMICIISYPTSRIYFRFSTDSSISHGKASVMALGFRGLRYHLTRSRSHTADCTQAGLPVGHWRGVNSTGSCRWIYLPVLACFGMGLWITATDQIDRALDKVQSTAHSILRYVVLYLPAGPSNGLNWSTPCGTTLYLSWPKRIPLQCVPR